MDADPLKVRPTVNFTFKLAISLVTLTAAFSLLPSCQSKEKPDRAKSPLVGAMQDIAGEVRDLIPFLYNSQAFQDPKNAPRIKLDLKKFAEKTHQITPEMSKAHFGQDPLQNFAIEGMKVDLSRALEAFEQGRTEYARNTAKAATVHCFSCHSVAKTGQMAAWDLSGFSNLELAPVEKVDLLVALRRFEEAEKYMEARLKDQNYLKDAPFDFETLLRKYFSLMIRIENNPNRPLKELDRILSENKMPVYVADQARGWRTSLREWSRSLPPKKFDLLEQSRARLKRGRELQQFPKDHTGDVEFLRATQMLHEYLRSQPGVEKRADAYLLLGQAYEVLDDLGYWNLHEVYYESCIKAVPKTDLAKQCYGRFEASVYFGFSGSSGTHIPAPDRERLRVLKAMTL